MLTACLPHHKTEFRPVVSGSLDSRIGAGLRPEVSDEGLLLADGLSLDDGLTESEAVAIALWNNAAFQLNLASLGFARADLIEAGLLRNPILSLLFPLGPKQLEATAMLPIEVLFQRPRRVAISALNLQRVAEGLVQNGLDVGREARLRMGGLTRVGWNLRAFVCAVGTRCGVIGRLLTRYPGGRGVWQRQ